MSSLVDIQQKNHISPSRVHQRLISTGSKTLSAAPKETEESSIVANRGRYLSVVTIDL